MDDFVLDFVNVFNEVMELKVIFKGFVFLEVEVVSLDCIDKVVLLESKVVVKEIY